MFEITNVTMRKGSEQLWGWHLDAPREATRDEIFAMAISGWVVGRTGRVTGVRVLDGENTVADIPVCLQRRDIPKAYPHFPPSEHCGFSAFVGMLGLPMAFDLALQAVFEDGTLLDLGSIRGTRERLDSGFQPRLQPLMITSLGRTGSTWVSSLLGMHPQLIAYRPFQFEPRISRYWMEVLGVLANPSSYLQGLLADLSDRKWWLGEQPIHISPTALDEPIRRCLGQHHVVASVRFSQSRIEEFYSEVAAVQNRPDPRYFVEKYSEDPVTSRYLLEFYPAAKEIFLVRDLRDTLCSMFAYNTKTRAAGFGYKNATCDEEFVEQKAIDARLHMSQWKSRSERAHLLRYEDLILRPVETLQAALRYLDLDDSQATAQRMLELATESHQAGQTFHKTSKDPRASIGRWRTDLSPALQTLSHEAFGDVLKEFGYS